MTAMNNLKTVGLLAFMTILVVLVADALGASVGQALAFAAVLNFIFYFFSDKMAIAAAKAVPIPDDQLPQLHEMVERLAGEAGIPVPRLYYIDSMQPNAFATGRNPKHAVIAVTKGILAMLDKEELEGVLAHELAHVTNRDILISSIAAMLAAALSIFARMTLFGGRRRGGGPVELVVGLLGIILAPIAAMILKSAISRSREYEADATGSQLSGQPLQLASALAKIGRGTREHPMRVNDAVSQLFIADPTAAFSTRAAMSRMFSTHPPIEDRITRLQEMAANRRR